MDTAPTSILLIRLSAIGDVVMASPLLRALRSRYPQAHIAWLAQPEVAPLIECHPCLDEVIVWPRGHWAALWRARRWGALGRAVWALRTELRRRRFDLVLDAQGLLKSGLLARLSGAPQRVGLGSREGSAVLMTRVVAKPRGEARIGSEYLALARALALPVGEFRQEVALAAADEAFARELAQEAGLAGGWAVLAPFTTRPQKHWFEERWVELARRLAAERGLVPLVLGGPGERAAAERLVARAGAPARSLAGATSLRQAAALIEHARLLVGVDTGLTHMAPAFDTPSVALFGATCPYRDTGRPRAIVLHHPMSCSPCRRRPTCNGQFPCMRAIGVDQVLAAVAEVCP